ncbi:acyl-CoA carboxylase subunit beta [Corynebacterium pseudotuberculosis]|uniref:acyl-CoA carboxylase subunit beta n=1 Tax=Corynebacterium pseudotuberculosis TaxID=1719 RepID=UPI0002504657|nr:acyl-CoA carboxylase subunit beta [Corynebacterium pseudotuberculosis]AFB71903.1 acyl-CoA carboxylase subunit beta [Corynebacterium pseudotuberculosis 316]ASC74925.1 acyl-CoA carboxylase subunit beta [Corynebacterium pseudotuberculosis]AUY60001.1 Methylmalonyl-CoA carboxyltransferase 12S subunit [Corynebacterium pseudotuberculosis]WAE79439.1 acyl-CoA carboxylase subunit beta [Corynebacterium pseudotuberculosis]WAE81488.1 acyl-CoA carboxylase subunit beta [Corynebacterium pseudotuberculosis]
MSQEPTMSERLDQLAKARHEIELGGGEAKIEKQHEKGKLTARERVAALLDEGTFREIGMFAKHRTTHFGMDKAVAPADGVVTGSGAIFGRAVHVASQDFTVMGGSAGETQSNKVAAMMEASATTGTPFIFINDSGGARVQEGIDSLSGYGKVFYQNVLLSGLVPQISIISGPCAGGAAYSPALTDFIIQTRKANMFITGPGVIKSVTGEEVTADALGGADAHMAKAGNIHFIADDDEQAVLIAQKLLSFLPQNNTEEPPVVEPDPIVTPDEELREIVPVDGKRGYDVRDIISRVVDRGDFLEVQAGYAQNLVVGFARIVGRTVGIVANQPNVMSGVLDINSSDKGSQFIRFCNAFNIPLVTFVDVPGFMPGIAQEHGGIIRHGAKMLYAYSAASVPKITVELRKSYGGAHLAMCSKDLGADRVFAWPTAEIAVMGAEGAVNVVFRKEIEAAEDKESKRNELIRLYKETFSTPYMAASRGLVDDIIDPAETRLHIADALEVLANKRVVRPAKKHGLGPV